MFGLLCIHKPAGPTSHDIVGGVRRRVGRGVKVGHAGTLDPFADGVLVVCVGPATRLAGYAQAQPKRYVARIRLGATSSTDDPDGEITVVAGAPVPDEAAVRDALRQFVGTIQQVPCSHSAVHVAGRRAYKLARAGQPVDLPPRTVVIHSIELVRYEYPHLEVDVRCGTGTYIRAVARDVGAVLNTSGYCEKLTRTAVGRFRIEDAVAPDDLNLPRDLLPPLLAVPDMPKVALDADQLDQLRHGRAMTLAQPAEPGEVALVDADGNLLALGEVAGDSRALRPKRVFCDGD